MVQLLKNSARKISYGWFDRFKQPTLTPPAWPLDHDEVGRASVYWPNEYQWPESAVFLEPVRLGMSHWAKVEKRDISQPYQGVCVFEMGFDGRHHRIAIDYSDYVDRIEKDCLDSVSLYFKMQCLERGYDLNLRDRRKILPGGYVTADRRMTNRLAGIRANCAKLRSGLQYLWAIRPGVRARDSNQRSRSSPKRSEFELPGRYEQGSVPAVLAGSFAV